MSILKIPFRLSDFKTPIRVVGSDSRIYTLKSDKVCKAFLDDKEINIKVGDTLILIRVKDLWTFKFKVGWFTFEFRNIGTVIDLEDIEIFSNILGTDRFEVYETNE